MNLEIKIDKNSPDPIYKQLLQQISEQISTYILSNPYLDKRLPPERELSALTGVARGTIKKAYSELAEMGIVEIIHGSGTFISDNASSQQQINECANEITIEYLQNLFDVGFCAAGIKTIVDINISLIKKQSGKMLVAAIDCNPETLSIIKKQFSQFDNILLFSFLLDDVLKFKHPTEIFKKFDAIFTTSKHYGELANFFGKLNDKMIKTALSPDVSTILELAAIPKEALVAVIANSAKFIEIIKINLNTIGISPLDDSCFLINEINKQVFDKLINKYKYIVVPPYYTVEVDNEYINLLINFYGNGGKAIPFNYVLERGSLIYIEEKAREYQV